MRILGLLLLFTFPFLHAEPTADEGGAAEIPTTGLVPLRPATEAQFAFLCLDNAKVAKVDTLKASLVKWFKLNSPNEILEFAYKPKTQSFSWRIGRSRFVATLEALPVPNNDIRYASNNSLHWPDAEKQMLTHQANYTVTCVSIHRTPWHAALDLSHALAAFAETHDTTGIYWGDAAIVHSPGSFLKQADYQLGTAKKIPSVLWVGILFESDTKGGWNIFTDGMRTLGHKDIEIHSSQLARSKLFATLNTLKHDILTKKLALKNDLVIDGDDASKWKVSTGASVIGKTQPVWILTQQ
jgi:hypothetical protein